MDITNGENLIEKVWGKYSKHDITKIEKADAGYKNAAFFVTEGSGAKFVLKIYNNSSSSASTTEQISQVAHSINPKAFSFVKAVCGTNGNFVQEIDSQHFAICTEFINDIAISTHPNLKTVKTTATALGQLHSELRKVKVELKRDFDPLKTLEDFTNTDSQQIIKDYIFNNVYLKKNYSQFVEFYEKTAQELVNFFETNKFILNDTQLVHGDFRLDNLDIKNDKVVTIFDFDEMKKAHVFLDIAIAVSYLDNGFLLTEEIIENFLVEYNKVNLLPKDSLNYISQLVMYYCYYRMARWLLRYRFVDHPRSHYTTHLSRLKKYQQIEWSKISERIW